MLESLLPFLNPLSAAAAGALSPSRSARYRLAAATASSELDSVGMMLSSLCFSDASAVYSPRTDGCNET